MLSVTLPSGLDCKIFCTLEKTHIGQPKVYKIPSRVGTDIFIYCKITHYIVPKEQILRKVSMSPNVERVQRCHLDSTVKYFAC